ncbi:MAG: DUF924 family protein [Pseudomonadota bacterium]
MSDPLVNEASGRDQDERDIERVLNLWFRQRELDTPGLDARMQFWFGEDAELDIQIRHQFGSLIKRASDGELDHWAEAADGRLALILVLDQFRRNAYRGRPEAFSHDRAALKLCVEGAIAKHDKALTPLQRAFFYMPMQHIESLKVQNKSVAVFRELAKGVTGTDQDTFETFADFAELHRDIVAQFGRFPHRNAILGRASTAEELTYLDDGPDFGQR